MTMFSSSNTNNNSNNNRNLKRSLSKSTSISSLKSILSKSFSSSNNLAGAASNINNSNYNRTTKKPTSNIKRHSPTHVAGASKSYGATSSGKNNNSTSPFKKIRLFKLFQSNASNINNNTSSNHGKHVFHNPHDTSTSSAISNATPTTAVTATTVTAESSFISASSDAAIPFKVPLNRTKTPTNDFLQNIEDQQQKISQKIHQANGDDDNDISMDVDDERNNNNGHNDENKYNEPYTASPIKPYKQVLQSNINFQNLSKLDKVPMATTTNIHHRAHQQISQRNSSLIPPSKSTFSFDASNVPKKKSVNNNSSINRLTSSKAYYNLSELTKDDSDEEEINQEIGHKNQNGYLASSSPINRKNDSSYLDYFHNNIEQFSSIKIHKLTTKLSRTTLNEPENVFYNHEPNISKPISMKDSSSSLFPDLINNDRILKTIFLQLLNFKSQKSLLNTKRLINKDRLNFWKRKVESFKFLDNTTKLNEYIFNDFLKYDDTKYSPVSNNTNYPAILNNLKSFENCLLVSRRFYTIGKELINYKLLFQNDQQFINFIKKGHGNNDNTDASANFQTLKAINSLILYKLNNIQQDQINYLSNMIIKNNGILNLKHLEFYIISNQVYPPMLLFTDNNLSKNGCHNLESLILAGCNSKKINNFFLKIVSINCPNLKKLDLRSCEYFTDNGLIEIGNNCLNLQNVNVGRFNNKDKITDSSINVLIKNMKNLIQLGCAGCNVTENILYQLLEYQNSNLMKLSLNYCENLKRFGTIFQKFIIEYKLSSNDNNLKLLFPNLNILEIRKLLDVSDDISQLIKFKKLKLSNSNQFVLDIGDSQKLKDFMLQKEFETSVSENVSLFKSLTEYCNNTKDPNDDDVDAKQYHMERLRDLKSKSNRSSNNSSKNNSFNDGIVGMEIEY